MCRRGDRSRDTVRKAESSLHCSRSAPQTHTDLHNYTPYTGRCAARVWRLKRGQRPGTPARDTGICSLVVPLLWQGSAIVICTRQSWNFANNLLIDCIKRVMIWWHFTNKTGFWQLTQRFYFIRKTILWDIIRQTSEPGVVGSNPSRRAIIAQVYPVLP